jgi:hypothetical protein
LTERDDAADNSRDNSAGAAPGRPFAKGDPRINRAGRPKNAAGFRQSCRELAERLVEELNGRTLTDLTIGQLLFAIQVIADRGGYLDGKDLANADSARLRAIVGALAVEHLSEAQRDTIIGGLRAREQEALAEVPQPADEGEQAPEG